MCTTMPGEPRSRTRVWCLSSVGPTVIVAEAVLLQEPILTSLFSRDNLGGTSSGPVGQCFVPACLQIAVRPSVATPLWAHLLL